MKKFILILITVFSLTFSLKAAFVKDVPRKMLQPDGDTLYCFVSGDEYHQWLHDAEGYTIVQDPETGYLVYADKNNGELVPTAYIAGQTDPAKMGLTPRLNISTDRWIEKKNARISVDPPEYSSKSGERNRGNINNLVVFISFKEDSVFRQPFSTIEKMFNGSEAGDNSMYNYYKRASYNQLFITTHFYPQPVDNVILSYCDTFPRNYYEPYNSVTNPDGYISGQSSSRERKLLISALNYVKSMIPDSLNFDSNEDGNIDNVCFIVKGSTGAWLDLLWPRMGSLRGENFLINGKRVGNYNFQLSEASQLFTTSVLCHEMFHSLGAPDLYHYNSTYEDLIPVGRLDLMAQNTNPPQQTNAYMKYKYGNWIDSIPEITKPGYYSLHLLSSEDNKNVCYKIVSDDPTQFFLLEYRASSRSNFDLVEGSGLVVYRINTRFNGNEYFNNSSAYDEVYAFRKNGSRTENGNHSLVYLNSRTNVNSLYPESSFYPFLSDGTLVEDLYIDQCVTAGDSITFRYSTSLPSDNINRYDSGKNISVYPNPFTDYVELRLLENGQQAEWVEVFDIYGRNIHTQVLSGLPARINLQHLSAGVYILKIKGEKQVLKSVKIIKK